MSKWLLGIIIVLSCTLITQPSISKPIPWKQLNCLVENVYFEARGEPLQGQYAIVWVTMQRAKNYNNICKTVWKPKQFSWTSHKYKKLSKTEWLKMANVVCKALQLRDTLKATHYHNNTVKPKWGLKKVMIIGRHTFYR